MTCDTDTRLPRSRPTTGHDALAGATCLPSSADSGGRALRVGTVVRVRADARVASAGTHGVRLRDLAAEGVVAATPSPGASHVSVYLEDGVRAIPRDALASIGAPVRVVPSAGECWVVALDAGHCHVRVVERDRDGMRVLLAGVPTRIESERFVRRVPSGEGVARV